MPQKKDVSPTLRPPLKWAGGKRWLVSELVKIFSQYKKRRLVEPFSGGLSVALGLEPKSALLNDSNTELINFYKALRAGLVIKSSMKNSRREYLQARTRFNRLVKAADAKSAKERASLFYYLNRTGFNGLCRFNSAGEFNVPFGKYERINYLYDFRGYKNTFKEWEFVCGDFSSLKVKKNDFLYVDPPYDVEFTKYSKGDFKWEDQIRLVKWLATQRCPIVASNQATPRILKLYRSHGFKVRTLPAPRRISCTGDRTPALEMLATKNIP